MRSTGHARRPGPPFLVSLANTTEPLYLGSRSGNSASHDGAVAWIDRAVELVRFAFGIDAMPNLVEIAEGLARRRWRVLKHRERESLTGERRRRPKNVKEKIVIERGYRNIRLQLNTLESNWSYMVIVSLAWTLKAWFALMARKREHRDQLLSMEFRRFLNGLIRMPVQIVTAGRRIVWRVIGYNQWVHTFLQTFDNVRRLQLEQ